MPDMLSDLGQNFGSKDANGVNKCSSIGSLSASCAKPILRWAGGKSHLIAALSRLLPDKWKRYVEPMVGAGALFFHLAPHTAILADINEDLMNFYRALRDQPQRLIPRLMELKPSRKRYYSLRRQTPRSMLDSAIRFAYLNRLCWNGLFRVNQKGQFNVPFGDRFPKSLWSEDDLWKAAQVLQHAELLTGDFSQTLRRVKRNDLVFIDPPYPRGAREDLGFNRYTSLVFSAKRHEELGRMVAELTAKRVKVILTLSDSPTITKLYPETLRRFHVTSKALISCKGTTRRKITESIFFNYRATEE